VWKNGDSSSRRAVQAAGEVGKASNKPQCEQGIKDTSEKENCIRFIVIARV
jgi:hypothetical protein